MYGLTTHGHSCVYALHNTTNDQVVGIVTIKLKNIVQGKLFIWTGHYYFSTVNLSLVSCLTVGHFCQSINIRQNSTCTCEMSSTKVLCNINP